MPELTYSGPGSRIYPETRDACGVPLGEVQPGEVRDLGEAPDQWWAAAQDQPPKLPRRTKAAPQTDPEASPASAADEPQEG